jgi:hypothetical protein
MPLATTHYVSGPIDEIVYDAADTAGLPVLVSSGYDGEATAWRWNVTPPGSPTLREVVLRIGGPKPGQLFVEVFVQILPPELRPQFARRLALTYRPLPSPADLDVTWLGERLAAAQAAALGFPIGKQSRKLLRRAA